MSEKIIILYGSTRRGRLGIRAVDFIRPLIESKGYDVGLLDAAEVDLPLLVSPFHHYTDDNRPETLKNLGGIIESAAGFVVVAGEYNHSIQPGLSNLIDHFYDQYTYKPAMIVSYSYGQFGGVRSEVQLRALLGEVGMSVIPRSLPIPKIGDNLDSQGKPINEKMPEYAAPVVEQFLWFVNALSAARKKGVPQS